MASGQPQDDHDKQVRAERHGEQHDEVAHRGRDAKEQALQRQLGNASCAALEWEFSVVFGVSRALTIRC